MPRPAPQALHWLERPRFYASAARALRAPSGVLAAFTYDAGDITPVGGPVDQVYKDMWLGVLGPYWAGPRCVCVCMCVCVCVCVDVCML